MALSTHTVVRVSGSIPARAGIGLRAKHHEDLLRGPTEVSWLEAHSENYFVDGGAQIEYLLRLRERYPLSLHGVGLSLGSVDPLSREHLWRLKRLVQLVEPGLVSEHLSWGSFDGTFMNDLLPMPYTEQALTLMIARVEEVQDYLGRQILIENVSSYLEYEHSTLREWEFVDALVAETGCGLLLDINNLYVNSRNHAFEARTYLDHIAPNSVCEIHLAGHTAKRDLDFELLIDTHDQPVCAEVWDLFSQAIERFGRVPTLIEWDANIPPLEVLAREALRADRYLVRHHELAA